MIIGLLGPSCSGKSYFLKRLKEDAQFHVPMSVVTRESRAEDSWHMRFVSLQEFDRMRDRNELYLVTEAFGNHYACIKSISHVENTAVIITKDNIPEIREIGGHVIRILPISLDKAIEKIIALERGNQEARISQIRKEFEEKTSDADATFRNSYHDGAFADFIKLLGTL